MDDGVLKTVKTAPRYEPRHFPYMNLGRIDARKGMVLRAIHATSAGAASDGTSSARGGSWW